MEDVSRTTALSALSTHWLAQNRAQLRYHNIPEVLHTRLAYKVTNKIFDGGSSFEYHLGEVVDERLRLPSRYTLHAIRDMGAVGYGGEDSSSSSSSNDVFLIDHMW